MSKSKTINDSFLSIFQMYYNFSTDAPPAFNWWLGVQLLGHAMGYHCVNLIVPDEVRHNINLLLVGDSTLSRKSTSQRLALNTYPSESLIPSGATPERLCQEMSEDSHRLMALGEFSILLKRVGAGGYMAPMVEILNDLYDCPAFSMPRALVKGKSKDASFPIVNAYLSVNSTITPEMLKENISLETITGGFLARWMVVSGISTPRDRGPLPAEVFSLRKSISEMFLLVTKWCKDSGVNFQFTPAAFKRYNEINAEAMKLGQYVSAFAGRYMDVLVKIADILYVSDAIGPLLTDLTMIRFTVKNLDGALKHCGKVPVNGIYMVDETYIDRAWEKIKPNLIEASNLAEYVSLEVPTAKLRDWLIREVPQTHATLMRRTKIESKYWKNAQQTLEDQGWLIWMNHEYTDSKGRVRALKYYCRGDKLNGPDCATCVTRKECDAKY
jgi:hypothetical protein